MQIKANQEVARSIKKNAQKVIQETGIDAVSEKFGELFYTGSYALDLMTWNDIDMQIKCKKGINELDALNQILSSMLHLSGFIEGKIIHFKGDFQPKMPRGVYLGLKVDIPRLGGLWKLDIWSLRSADFKKNRDLIQSLVSKLDQSTRDLILQVKTEMMKNYGRVPKMGSHLLYQAVLLNGVREKEAIYNYFDIQGLDVKR